MVELAFEHTFLLHGLLALSAVHKASLLPPMARQELLLQADAHISPALDRMRNHLSVPDAETAKPMFVLSTIFLTYNFGSVQEKPEDPIISLHHCFMLLNGIKVVVGPYWDMIKDDPKIALMLESTSQTLSSEALAKEHERPEILRLIGLTELVLSQDDKMACVEAINMLHYVGQVGSLSRDEYPFLFIWAAKVSNRFFELLASHNPVACIITCHSAALEAQAHTVWWVVQWPGWLLAATEQLLAKTPDLLEWLDWPRKVIHTAQETAAVSPDMRL